MNKEKLINQIFDLFDNSLFISTDLTELWEKLNSINDIEELKSIKQSFLKLESIFKK